MIGYACLPVGFRDYSFKKVLKKNLNYENLKIAIKNNLNSLNKILDNNIGNNIKLFRISSDLIPFGDKALEYIDWKKEFKCEFEKIGQKIKENNLRVSFHPGQYTVLNSPKEEVVKNATMDLKYHCNVLDLMNLDKNHKIILHVGGVYGNKELATKRFIENYKKLDENIKNRLVIENDDKSYNVDDLLYINSQIEIPLVFDNLHNEINPAKTKRNEEEIIKIFAKTWKKSDGKQKTHYSQQDKNKQIGSHSKTIDILEFKKYYEKIDQEIDIMLEVKDKDLSSIKINNLFKNHVKYLEKEWAKYKYNILEHSPKNYFEIRELLKDRQNYNILEFYELIDSSLEKEIEKNNFINSSDHVWGYFKKIAEEKEIEKYQRYKEKYLENKITIKPIKKYLLQLSEKYKSEYLLKSYYFNI